MIIRKAILSIACVLALASVAPAQKWGTVSGQFVFEGAAPEKTIVPTKDVEVCGKHKLIDESLEVNPANKGLANVIVWLYPASGAKVDVHPDYAAAAGAKVEVDNKDCRFQPHVTVLRVGQMLVVGNGDPIGHNTKIDTLENKAENIMIPAGGSAEVKMTGEEKLPATMSCSIHPWMTGRLVVKDHPYVAVSDKDGKFTIKNVPAGDWKFKVWQESKGYPKTLNGKSLSKGVWELTVKEGDNDQGQLKFGVE